MQGYDSVAVEADVELGGTDQSLTCGTRFATTFWSEASVWSTDADFAGKRWSAENVEVPDNYVGVQEDPLTMYSKLEKIPDHLLEKYFELLTDLSLFELPEQRAIARNSRLDIVTQYHGKAKACSASSDVIVTRAGGVGSTASLPPGDTPHISALPVFSLK